MTRVKRSVHARKKRRKVLSQASGYWGLKSIVGIRLSEEQEFEGADLTIHNISSTPEKSPVP